jgi:16S rRNA (adenine1518-N6/adenine1519-N6)-dimethyltransferase
VAKRELGQNFLFDSSILERIVGASGVSEIDTVAEIGPGPGGLTRRLAARVKKVIAIELDESLYTRLRAELAGYRNIELIHGDAMKFPYEEIGPFKVVANIPYYITTPIIFRLLAAKETLRTMTLTIQKEVAERIVAPPGGKDYGVLSIMVQYLAKPDLRFVIPKEAFRPKPKVDSAVVHLTILDEPSVRVEDEQMFFRVVKTTFSQRRKTLSNSLRGLTKDPRGALSAAGIDAQRRPETLSLAEFARLAATLTHS